MVVGLLGNESPDLNRFTLVTPKPANGVRLQATLDNQNPTGLPVGAVSDDITHWKLIWSTIVVSILVFSISVVMAKIPKPRLPMSLVIYQNKYVIKQALRYTLRPLVENVDSEYDSSHINNQCAEIGTVYLIARE